MRPFKISLRRALRRALRGRPSRTTFRELDWKTPVLVERAVLTTQNAWRLGSRFPTTPPQDAAQGPGADWGAQVEAPAMPRAIRLELLGGIFLLVCAPHWVEPEGMGGCRATAPERECECEWE